MWEGIAVATGTVVAESSGILWQFTEEDSAGVAIKPENYKHIHVS
jgi:hypothetical protein